MKVFPTLFLSALGLAALPGCEKTAPSFSGIICMELVHHDIPFKGATVYHIANQEESPGFADDMDALYDRKKETGLRSTICFDSLTLGQHHFSATGYDEFLRAPILGAFQMELTVLTPNVDTLMQVSEVH